MEIAEQLQHEAEKQAGSPEGFATLIRLVLETVEAEEELELPSVSLRSTPSLSFRSMHLDQFGFAPSEYLPIFREYVCLMQEVWYKRRCAAFIESPEWHNRQHMYAGTRKEQYAKAQKELSDKTHEARRKRRELPIHAYKRILKIESHFGDQLYLPANWEPLAYAVERYICRWGEGKLPNAGPNMNEMNQAWKMMRHLRGS